ncbi:MAG: ribonuclease HII [Chloroflexi bacterium]|nr:ribonuclease HII [Chloroflexota bacterium]
MPLLLPTLVRERALWRAGASRVAGVDEVGVGPLCAAVVTAAVILPPNVRAARLAGVRDSKTILNPRKREELAEIVRSVAVRVAVGAASPREIERVNVRGATALAMRRALARVGQYDHALLDGRPMPGLDPDQHTFVVDGDALCLSIACASLVAKVTRDRLLELLAQRYPAYGWERNRGYATAGHLAALRRYGPTPHHRGRFRPVLQAEMFPPEPAVPGASPA